MMKKEYVKPELDIIKMWRKLEYKIFNFVSSSDKLRHVIFEKRFKNTCNVTNLDNSYNKIIDINVINKNCKCYSEHFGGFIKSITLTFEELELLLITIKNIDSIIYNIR